MKKSLGAACITALMALTVACGSNAGGGGGSSADGTLSVATFTPPSSFAVGEMASSGPEDTYYQAVYDKLFELDSEGQPVPSLVTEWKYDESNTKLSLTLRDDVKFTDGTAFDADAVKKNIEAARAASGEAGSALTSVTSVDVVDATHADLVLGRPDPGLVAVLARSSGYMASPAALGSPDLATNPVGSGPYVFDQAASTTGSIYVFERNADYWNADAYSYDKLELRFLDDNSAIVNGLRSGNIDASVTSSQDVISAAESGGLNVEKYFNGAIEGVFLWDRNGALAPELADVRVRQALNYATDRKTIVDVVRGGLGTSTTQIFGPSSDAYVESLNESYPFDLDKAKQLMAEAGYADGFDLSLPDFSPIFPNEQAAMDEMLKSLNIRASFQPITGDQAIGSIMGGQWPLNQFMLTASSPYEMIALALTEQSPFNPFNSTDPELTKLVDAAYTAPVDEQPEALQALNTWLVDNAWFLPWDAAEASIVSSKSVTVATVPGVGVPPLASFTPAG